jgi:tetratricopeptide (TPR) repeat protein
LILDDLDSILANDPEGVVCLLHKVMSCWRLKVVVTSRCELPGDIVYRRYPVNRIPEDASILAFQRYSQSADVQLPGEQYLEDLEAVLSFLDGYPFAIRLAAVYMMQTRCGLSELKTRLFSDPIPVLRYPRELEDRKTSLSATLSLSYKALPPAAREVLPLLALFPAGLTDDAARSILGGDSIRGLESLLQFSMAEARTNEPERRFKLPEPARVYSESFQLGNEMENYGIKALFYYHSFLSRLSKLLENESYVQRGRANILAELPNIIKFLNWGYSNETSDDCKCWSARTTSLLGPYWVRASKGEYENGLVLLRQSLFAATRLGDAAGEAEVHSTIGSLYRSQSSPGPALESYEQSLAIYLQINSFYSAGLASSTIGDILLELRNPGEAVTRYRSAIDFLQMNTVNPTLGQTLCGQVYSKTADVLLELGLTDEAISAYEGGIAIFKSLKLLVNTAALNLKVGDLLRKSGNLDGAVARYGEANSYYEQGGQQIDAALALVRMGEVFHTQVKLKEAMISYQKASVIFKSIKDISREEEMKKRIDLILQSY